VVGWLAVLPGKAWSAAQTMDLAEWRCCMVRLLQAYALNARQSEKFLNFTVILKFYS
jgi:hypothetical protein